MGKKTDKSYITMKEWTEDFGGKKIVREGEADFRPLPFYCCSLSFLPFEDPVCTNDGVIYDITNIIPFLKKFHVDPVTGVPMTPKDLFPLHFHKNEQGRYTCPVTYKEFTDHSHIVAIRTSGHVFSFDAIEELCFKAKNLKCLLTDTPFTRKDVIPIQDPTNLTRRNLANFHHVKHELKAVEEKPDALANLQIPESTKKIIRELNKRVDTKKEEKIEHNTAYSSVDAAAAGFTSSAFSDKTIKFDPRLIIVRPEKKGYARIHTNLGDINIELHCDLTPKTCENWIGLAEKGFYNGVKFHRLVPGFMIQGGDPTGTGRGGDSIWGKPFQDEFTPRLQHCARGTISMANKGKDTNTSQFFIAFDAHMDLNMKHTLFARVVGGQEVLSKMEDVETDEQERPVTDIVIDKVTVFVNPYRELQEEAMKPQAVKDKEAEAARAAKRKEQEIGQWYSNPAASLPTATKAGVGKYMKSAAPALPSSSSSATAKEPSGSRPAASSIRTLLPPAKKANYGDFSSW